jgi:predicted dehydrogenase
VGYPASAAHLNAPRPGDGALLNFGVYGISLAHFLFGPPSSVVSTMMADANGLDLCVSATLGYPLKVVQINANIAGPMGNDAIIVGDRGGLRLGPPFFAARDLQHLPNRPPSALPIPSTDFSPGSFWGAVFKGGASLVPPPLRPSGMRREAEEVMRCLAGGRTESNIMPLSDSIAVMDTLDVIEESCRGGRDHPEDFRSRPRSGGIQA